MPGNRIVYRRSENTPNHHRLITSIRKVLPHLQASLRSAIGERPESRPESTEIEPWYQPP